VEKFARLNMSSWTLRRAVARDADALAACIDAAYAQYVSRIVDLPDVSADCAEEIETYLVWVAEVAGDIVGGLVISPQEGFVQLVNIAVHPNQRGKGLGRALLALADTEARTQGFSEMRLATHRDMPENVELYAHLGWQRTGDDGAKVFMNKRL